MADIRYAIKRGNRWLQGIEHNSNYVGNKTAPTMGTRYTYSEFRTVWGKEQAFFERLTLANYIKVLTEEYRWGDLMPMEFKVVAVHGGADNERKAD